MKFSAQMQIETQWQSDDQIWKLFKFQMADGSRLLF